jgi:predicted TIM-barrel enzyme
MRNVILGAAAALVAGVLAVQPAVAAEPEAAKLTTTVFVGKGNSSAVTKALNKMHAQMEAQGWSYADMGVYTEDGDLQGIFVTYVRSSVPAAAPAP